MILQREVVVAARVAVVAVARVGVAEVIHLGKMEQEAPDTKATLSALNVTSMATMPTVAWRRRKAVMKLIMIWQKT